EGDALAVGRYVHALDSPWAGEDRVAEREVDELGRTHLARDGQLAVGGEVGGDDVLGDVARRGARERHACQGVAVVDRRDLAGAADGQEPVARLAEAARVAAARDGGVDARRLVAPARGIDDGLTVGREARAVDDPAPEAQPLVLDVARGRG